jgi:hypothetical protein
MKNILFLTLLTTLFTFELSAQDLMKEQIRPLQTNKKSIYIQDGTFYTKPINKNAMLKKIRNSYVRSRGYERIVFDFDGTLPPQTYGHISGSENKIYIDLFNTQLASTVKQLKHIKFIKNIDFYTMDKEHTSVELKFVKNASYDIFYLKNPARLVIDVRK